MLVLRIFRPYKESDFYHFCISYLIYCNEALCKFLQKVNPIYYRKCSKNTNFGLFFRGDIDFLRLWPIKLCLIISKLLGIDFTLKNRLKIHITWSLHLKQKILQKMQLSNKFSSSLYYNHNNVIYNLRELGQGMMMNHYGKCMSLW